MTQRAIAITATAGFAALLAGCSSLPERPQTAEADVEGEAEAECVEVEGQGNRPDYLECDGVPRRTSGRLGAQQDVRESVLRSMMRGQ